MPVIMISIFLTTSIFIINTRSSISDLQFEDMAYKLEVLKKSCSYEHSVLKRLGLVEMEFYVNNAKGRIVDMSKEIIIPGGYIFIVEKDSELIYHPQLTKEQFSNSQLRDVITMLQHDKVIHEPIQYTLDSEEYLAVYLCFDEWSWVMIATAKKDVVYSGIKNSIKLSLFAGGFAMVFAFLQLAIISKSITKPIGILTESALKMSEGDLDVVVDIKSRNEFSTLAKVFNDMAAQLKFDFKQNHVQIKEIQKVSEELRESELELKALNSELEERINERTMELEMSLETLMATQKQLIESEKMAALGSLVTGISHEINTPIGICVTSTSYLKAEIDKINVLYNSSKLKRVIIEEFIENSIESTKITLKNLKCASELINNFKLIAVDQSSHDRRKFEICEYISQYVEIFCLEIRKMGHSININSCEDVEMDSYPGVLSQVLNSLIQNSLIHGFEGLENRVIDIDITVAGESLLFIFKDNGRGIPEDLVLRVFEPFYTTRMGKGGSGLGLHIVYNLVTAILEGSIECKSVLNKGVTFVIQIPIEVSRGK